MWRFIKAVPRVLRQQINSSVRPSPQSVQYEEEQDKTKKTALVPINYLPWNQRWHVGVNTEKSSKRQEGGQRTQPNPSWTLPNCQPSFIEAVGCGSAILLGLQVYKIYHLRIRKKKRHAHAHAHRKSCPINWLHRIACARRDVPALTSYINSTAAPPSVGEQILSPNYGPPSQVPDPLPGEDAGGRARFDYDSLQVIELEFEQFDCSHLLCNCDADSSCDVYQPPAPSRASQHAKEEDPIADASENGETAPVELTLEEAVAEWCSLSAQCIAKVHHHLAFSALRRGEAREAFAQWQQACHKGDLRTHFNLALCYELGKGTAKDLRKAAEHYAMAAAGGHVMATYNLAVYRLKGLGGVERDVGAAMELLERAADGGLRQAQTDLGVLVVERGGDWTYAAKLFTSAAQKDDTTAQYYLGVCYENGWGVRLDPARAVQLYTSAAEGGHGPALHTLAVLTERGRAGVMPDRSAACNLYGRAAEAGHASSEAEHKRLTMELNQERLELELNVACNVHALSKASRRCKSSPALSLSTFSNYVRDNLLDFGLDDPETPVTSPTAAADVGVALPVGQAVCSVVVSREPGDAGYQLTPGGFGDVLARQEPALVPASAARPAGKVVAAPAKLNGTFGGFDPHIFRSDVGYLLEREAKPAEMGMVACS